MYDGLTGRYTFSCPRRGETRVRLSSFRTFDRLAGAAHPVVYRVTFSCGCGDDHEGLVSHDDLDWAPLTASAATFFNVMTSRLESVAAELLDLAVRHIRAGEWPWSFFCYPEATARPAFPSDFRMLAPGGSGVGVAVRCPSCARTSVNLVSHEHVDVPFYNDSHIAVVEHIFASDGNQTLEAFREELSSGSFDARRRDLAA
jgi:hypothetical protein